ncbi:uncharacterized protein L969DRAFT_16461 [Mixia osmundae IAM 14324]|nr:uncharacterized protein L969DRAFT_16461 [Mixia osmundae IAM 14324]KEI41110.1 hypothetical protein L969DRAFT_16461 [Mixia osmundae IAM 14324]
MPSTSRSAFVIAGGAVVGVIGGSALLGSSGSDKRKALLASKNKAATNETPNVVHDKAKEVAQQTAAGDPSQPEEGEQDSSAAFNPETGEINWDCPCLGGMAHGPCGAEFKEAFSCFVFSDETPKGAGCIDKFKGMQDCFRAHPDHYGADMIGEEDGDEDSSEGSSEPGMIDKAHDTYESLTEAAEGALGRVSSVFSSGDTTAGRDDEHKSQHKQQGSSPSLNATTGDVHAGGSQMHSTTASRSGKDALHPEKTPNTTGGRKDPTGRNAAKGNQPSGSSSSAQDKFKASVESTRSGQDKDQAGSAASRHKTA